MCNEAKPTQKMESRQFGCFVTKKYTSLIDIDVIKLDIPVRLLILFHFQFDLFIRNVSFQKAHEYCYALGQLYRNKIRLTCLITIYMSFDISFI